MGRQIVSSTDVAKSIQLGSPRDKVRAPDTYVDRLVKYIPPDVIAAYATIEGMIAAGAHGRELPILAWTVFAVILVACPFYLKRVGGVSKPLQLALSTFAFAVWAFAYAGPPFSLLQIAPTHGPVLLALTTFLIPIIET